MIHSYACSRYLWVAIRVAWVSHLSPSLFGYESLLTFCSFLIAALCYLPTRVHSVVEFYHTVC